VFDAILIDYFVNQLNKSRRYNAKRKFKYQIKSSPLWVRRVKITSQ
ncbi:MAG: hypothetical protein ACI9KI_000885, partial [Patiriisocius sp.]